MVLDGLSKDLNSGATSQTNEIARDHNGLLFRTLQKVEIAGNLTLRRRLETPLRLLTSSEPFDYPQFFTRLQQQIQY